MTAKILIIEDEAVIRRELQILLENAMYEAAAPADFGDVPGQVRAFAPDLILLDVNLPGCSGFDLCTQIRAVLKRANSVRIKETSPSRRVYFADGSDRVSVGE